jgi:hypothetical protein
VTPDTPDLTLSQLTRPAGHAPGARKRRTGLVVGLVVIGAVVLGGAGVALGLSLGRHGATAGAAATTAAAGTLVVEGYLELDRGDFTWKSEDDPVCSGTNAFSAFRRGAEVTVSDATGKTLVVGALDDGRAVDISNGYAGSCRLTFTVRGVPRGVGPYSLAVSQRPAGHYTESELTSRAVELSFG